MTPPSGPALGFDYIAWQRPISSQKANNVLITIMAPPRAHLKSADWTPAQLFDNRFRDVSFAFNDGRIAARKRQLLY